MTDGCGAAICLAAQPSTVFGSPDVMVVRGVSETLAVTGALADAIVAAVRGKTTASAITSAINGSAKRFGTGKIEKPIGRELMHGALLGALDAWHESETDRFIPVESFAAPRRGYLLAGFGGDTRFSARSLADAIKAFLEKKAVTREVFDEMEKAAQRRAFTVAKAANEAMVRVVKQELVRQLAVGADLRDFGKHAAARFESAGWTPASGSHVETIFRTNVLNSYNGGRARQQLQPEVLEVRPFLQWLGVGDGPPRQRPTHQAMHGVVLRASDPFWQRAYPPAGYNCRCRARSLSLRQGASHVQDGARFTRVPDAGFTAGLPALFEGASLPSTTPANDPPPERERAND
jgi:SPP1 gp7 family putative phage head morphogenesis protein